jgi:AraC family L-rhamnose operon regulatory protein RhaS
MTGLSEVIGSWKTIEIWMPQYDRRASSPRRSRRSPWKARAAGGRTPVPAEHADHPARARVAAYAADLARTFYHRQTVNEAAQSLGVSRRHFTQLFRETTGESWLEALHRHRLDHARRLLRETGRSITSIGYECGFEDLTTFYRAFKAAEKTSPLAWRATRANERAHDPDRG